jgi:hypothetical protein
MRSLCFHFVLLAAFTAGMIIVVALIVQLDYPFRGEVAISKEPFQHVLSELELQLGPNGSTGAKP